MKVKNVILTIWLLFISSNALAECWDNVGKQSMYGSYEQAVKLKDMISKNDKCSFFAFSWKIELPTGMIINSFLLYDKKKEQLVRAKFEQFPGLSESSLRWGQWLKVTKSKIEKLDPSYGLDFDPFKTGKGRLPITKEAKAFVKKNAPIKLFKQGI